MRFFFYGTLIEGSENSVARAAHVKLRPLGRATARGRLFGIADPRGWYPALLPGRTLVHGMLYEASPAFGPADLTRLDAYEDFDPDDPAGSLYVRLPIRVSDAQGGVRSAQAYRFNRPLPASARPIRCGDFRAWLLESGHRPLGGAHSDPAQA